MKPIDDSTRPSGPRSGGPLLWLVVLIPLATVVAGIGTVVIATRTGSTDAVIDPVRRTAQVQDSDLRADREAARLGLSGRAGVDAGTGAVRLSPGRATTEADIDRAARALIAAWRQATTGHVTGASR